MRITATEARKKFAEVLNNVMQGGIVLITKYQTPRAVLLSMEEFQSLSRVAETRLDVLARGFDQLLLRMQTPKARASMKKAFTASSEQLGKAALAVARKSG